MMPRFTPFNFVTTITSDQGGGGFPGYPSLTMSGLSGLGGLGSEELSGFGAVSQLRKRYIRRLARRIAGKGSTMRQFYSAPSNRFRALQNIYFRRQLFHFSGNPLFRRPLDAEEWQDVFVPAYKRLRPDDRIPGGKKTKAAADQVEPLKEVADAGDQGDQFYNEDGEGSGAGITTSGASALLGRVPGEIVPVTSLDGLASRLKSRASALSAEIGRARGRQDVVLRIRRIRLLWAAALAEAAETSGSSAKEAALGRIKGMFTLPIYYLNGVVRVDCSGGDGADAGLSGLGYFPGAAYGPGAGMNLIPQVAAGYLPAQPPEILRHTFDVVSRTVIPGDRPGAVQVPRFATNNLPDTLAAMQPRPPFQYPQGPMTGVTAFALPNGQIFAPPPGKGYIPAAVNQELGKPKLPATLPVVGGSTTTRTQIAGFGGLGAFGASSTGGTGRAASNAVLLALVSYTVQNSRARAVASKAVNVYAKARTSDKKQQAAYRRLLLAAFNRPAPACSAEGVRVVPVGEVYDESIGA